MGEAAEGLQRCRFNGIDAPSSSRRRQRHLILFTVVRDPFEMSTEEFQCFEMVIGQLVDLRGMQRQDRVTVSTVSTLTSGLQSVYSPASSAPLISPQGLRFCWLQ